MPNTADSLSARAVPAIPAGQINLARETVRVTLDAVIHKEKPKVYVSYCDALDLASFGNTPQHATEMIADAVEMFIESCFEHGTLDEVLNQCGFASRADFLAGKRGAINIDSENEFYGTFIKQTTFSAKLPAAAFG